MEGVEKGWAASWWLYEILRPPNCEVTNPSSDTALVLQDGTDNDLLKLQQSVLRKQKVFPENTPDVADTADAIASTSFEDVFGIQRGNLN